MTTNVGTVDRIVRIVVGLALIAWALGYIPGWGSSMWGWIGVPLVLTGLIGWCPPYTLLGINTCSRKA